jgi:hypothetical protein
LNCYGLDNDDRHTNIEAPVFVNHTGRVTVADPDGKQQEQ